ncbi:MAG: Crp/Fnr family transcriptional regulator [Candidatus Hydrogenedentes bacterium]|nr:Crp/Fnr family transcriptional regulator [Candidatus Hydrogenedentota bacterium]
MGTSRSFTGGPENVALLSSFSPELWARLDGLTQFRECGVRESIYFPEDPCDSVYWIEVGRVKLSRVSPDGRVLSLRHHSTGDMFGEDCMSGWEQRCDHAESMEATRLRFMSAEAFRSVLDSDLEFARAVLERVSRRAREMDHLYAEAVFRPVRGRIAAGLLRLYQLERPVGRTIRVTHQEVANLAGSTRETTTAVLHSLREAGVVETGNRRVTLLDLEALRKAAQQY